ncbi:MAG: MBOAT family protein [Clostridia bacterium]|nr:MBOAT family protein [Clostridia bacterium]
MLFNSYEFIFAFLPITLIVYFVFHHFGKSAFAKAWLVFCSLFFYAYFNFAYLWIIVLSIVANYLIGSYLVKRQGKKTAVCKLLFAAGLILNIGMLFFYKYLDFTFATVANIFNTDPIHLGLILPLGISYITFHQISYLTDSYRGEAAQYSFLDYSLFVSFFPKLIAGPIVPHGELIPQFENSDNFKFKFENLSCGLFAFSRGIAKKVLVADNFAKIVTYGYANVKGLSSFETVLTILAYTFQIYFDFSGYCDMASGIAKMFNIDLPLNFNSPYKARNISDFWKRWHITLTSFLTRYVYFPLGGSRRGNARTYLNIFIVFLVSGIWHGAGFTFIVWGLLHGAAQVIYRALKKPIDKIPYAVTCIATFIFVSITWVFFRAVTIPDALQMLSGIFKGGFTLSAELTETLLNIIPISVVTNVLHFNWTLKALLIAIMAGTCAVCFFTKNVQEKAKTFSPSVLNLISTAFLLVWSMLSLSGVSTFLYSNF